MTGPEVLPTKDADVEVVEVSGVVPVEGRDRELTPEEAEAVSKLLERFIRGSNRPGWPFETALEKLRALASGGAVPDPREGELEELRAVVVDLLNWALYTEGEDDEDEACRHAAINAARAALSPAPGREGEGR